MIYLYGDTHGEIDPKKLDNSIIYKINEVFPDYVIILGDFGFIWNNSSNDPTENYWLKWLNNKPFKILFLKGNHENHFRLNGNEFPIISMFDSYVRKISNNIFCLEHGNIYTIENKKFFIMGSAESIDKNQRRIYIDWWPEEIPSYNNYLNALNNLEKNNYNVDYILTHTLPKNIIKRFFFNDEKITDPTTEMLEKLESRIIYKHWYSGHFHIDKKLNDYFSVVYNDPVIL